MSTYLYDESLVNRLREVINDDRIHVIPPEESISFLAKVGKDKTYFPAVVVSRGPITLTTDTRNQFVYLKGQSVRLNEDNTVTKVKLIPMRMEWSINIYAVERYTCDEIVREIVFYLMSHPRFEVKVPYGVDITQNFDVFVDPEIVDNSDLSEFSNVGDYFRETLTVYTENAHLYSSRRQYLTQAKPEVEDHLY